MPGSTLEGRPIRPAASPVDRSVDHTQDGSKAMQLARALSSVGPEGAEFARLMYNKRLAKQREEDTNRATVDVNNIHEADLTRKGVIPADASETYRRAFAERLGSRLSVEYSLAAQEFAAKELADETDTDKATEKLAAFDTDWQTANLSEDVRKNPTAMAAFNSSLQGIRYNISSQVIARTSARFKEQSETDFRALVATTTAAIWNQPETEDRSGKLTNTLRAIRQHAYDGGMNGKVVNDLTVEAVSTLAIERGDPSIIEAARNLPTGKEGEATFGNTPALATKLDSAEVRANDRQISRLRQEHEARQTAIDAVRNRFMGEMASAKNPERVDVASYVEEIRKLDPDAVASLLNDRTRLLAVKDLSSATHSDGQVMNTLKANPSEARVTLDELFLEGHITRDQYRDFSDYAGHLQTANRPSGNRGIARSILADSERIIRNALKGAGMDATEVSDALAAFEISADRYLSGNGNGADEVTVRKYLSDLRDALLRDKLASSTDQNSN